MGYAKDVLVSTDWLAEHLGDGDVVAAEVDENPDLYEEGHIPGAVKLHWRDDLQDPLERDLVEKAEFERLLGERGIGNDTTVVVYGDKNNWFAAYAYWYLKIYGHADVRILDGGRQKWIDEGRELTTDPASPAAVGYSAADRDESIRARRDQVLEWLAREGHALVDVRSPQEYAGELMAPPGYEQEGASRSGHIPTAKSIPSATPCCGIQPPNQCTTSWPSACRSRRTASTVVAAAAPIASASRTGAGATWSREAVRAAASSGTATSSGGIHVIPRCPRPGPDRRSPRAGARRARVRGSVPSPRR